MFKKKKKSDYSLPAQCVMGRVLYVVTALRCSEHAPPGRIVCTYVCTGVDWILYAIVRST